MDIVALIVFIVFMLFLLGIGLVAGKKEKVTASQKDYYIAGGKMNKFVLASTVIATSIGGGVTLTWVGMGQINGVGVFWYGLVQTFGYIMAALFFCKIFRAGDYISIPDFYDDVYKYKPLSIAIAIVSLIVPITWCCGQFKVGATMLEAVVGVPLNVGIFVFGGIIIAYTIFGGFTAVAYTDFVQFLLFTILFFITMPWVVADGGGLGTVLRNCDPALLKGINPFKINGYPWYTIVCWIPMGFTTCLGMQSSFQRIMAAKSDDEASFSIKCNVVMNLIFTVLVLFAGLSISTMSGSEGLSGNNSLTWWLTNRAPYAVAMGYLILIVMSTGSSADSMLNTFALNVGRDLYQKYINPKASDKSALRVGIIAAAIFGVISLFWAMNSSGLIVSIFGAASSMGAAPLCGVMYMTRFSKVRTGKAAFWSLIAGVCIGVYTTYWLPGISEIPSAATIFSLLGTMIIYFIIARCTKGKNNENVITPPWDKKAA